MTATSILVYIALIGFVLYRRITGQPVTSTKKLVVLPVIVAILGYQDVAHSAHLDSIDVAVAVIGSALALAFGALRGFVDKVSVRNGAPWVQWGAKSIGVLVVNIALKLVIDLVSVAAGGTTAGASSSLVLTLGLTLLGEAAVIFFRTQLSGSTSTSGGPSTGGGFSGLREVGDRLQGR